MSNYNNIIMGTPINYEDLLNKNYIFINNNDVSKINKKCTFFHYLFLITSSILTIIIIILIYS